MPKPCETQQEAAEHNPHWLAFWEIVLREGARLDAREAESAGVAEAEKR